LEVRRSLEKAVTSVPVSRKVTTRLVLGSDWFPTAGLMIVLPPNVARTLLAESRN